MNFRQRWANSNWAAAILMPVLVILMEVFWVYPWTVWVGKWPTLVWQRTPLSLPSLILLMGASFFATRFLLGRRWALKWIQISTVAGGLVVMFVVMRLEYGGGFGLFNWRWFTYFGGILLDSFTHLHPALVALVVGVYFWWRGISRGRRPLYADSIYRTLLVGIAASVMLVILWNISLVSHSLEDMAATVGPQVAAFFFFGLAALALSNLQFVQRNLLPEDRTSVFNRRWLPILFGMVGGIVFLAIGMVSIFSWDFTAFLAGLFDSILEVLFRVLLYILIPLGYVVDALFYALRFILDWLRNERTLRPLERPDFSMSARLQAQATGTALPEAAVLAIKWTLFVIIAAAIIFLLTKAVSRYRSSREKTDVEEIDESLWSWEVFKADARLLLTMLLQGFRRKERRAVVAGGGPVSYVEDEVEGILNIRQIYRRLLWQASRFGIIRRHHETPSEFAKRLRQAVPDSSEQVGELTDLYMGVRYGEVEADDRQVTYANRIWRVLKRLLGPPSNQQY